MDLKSILRGFWEVLGVAEGSKKNEKALSEASSKSNSTFGRSWEAFGRVLGGFWEGCGSLWRLWGPFGSLWGGFGVVLA